jgi:site-specific DNA-methyltransferase (adenine-specific)
MEYLCILTKTPTGGIVLDPFAGSGTTGIACRRTDRDYILIEKDPEYWKVARKRIEPELNQLKLQI